MDTSGLRAWQLGWLRAEGGVGSDGQERVRIAAPVCSGADWSVLVRDGDPEMLLRTIFALLLAVNSGCEVVSLAVRRNDAEGRICSLAVDSNSSIQDLMDSWRGKNRETEDAKMSLQLLRHMIDEADMPEFRVVGPGLEADASSADDGHPLRCLAHAGHDGAEWVLDARRGPADEAILLSLHDQAVRLLHALAADPATPVVHLARGLRPILFDVGVVGAANSSELSTALRAWGEVIGLPVNARPAEPGPVHNLGDGDLQLSPWGARLVVVGPDVPELPPVVEQFLPETVSGAVTGWLPHSGPIAEINANETRELYDEIVRRRRYLRHGVTIAKGDVVIDVGANIGMFTLFAAAQAPNVHVHAFEPVPAIADVLARNVELHRAKATVCRAALGAVSGRRTITFYPRSSLQSGFHTDRDTDNGVVRAYARHQMFRRPEIDPALRTEVEQVLAPAVDSRTDDAEQFDVPTLRLSDWIAAQGLSRINLLKIDAERSEEEVLTGIEDAHWPLVEQVVAEVHDQNGRLERIIRLLRLYDFIVRTEQDPWFAGSELHMVYARRPDRPLFEASLPHLIAETSHWAASSSVPVFVTVPAWTEDDDVRAARQATEAAGLRWISPPDPGTAPIDWAGTVLRALTVDSRPVAKAVLVDADNTLWGGVCGEIGAEGITFGSPYQEVQEFLQRQARAGRALCLCTRNNREDVRAVFEAHPGMPLRLDDFASVHANWGPKSASVSAVAAELGFAVESLVYIDDSPAERTEVALQHPGLVVVDLPDDPSGYLLALESTWQLDLGTAITPEDRVRGRLHAEEVGRRSATAHAKTTEEYLRAVQLEIDVTASREDEADRICQLAARTTQFNLMLRQHTPGSVRELFARQVTALSVRVRDRFGDYGLVGFMSADVEQETLVVRDFLLSCRVLGRAVEWQMLRELGRCAVGAGMSRIRLGGVAGSRNRPALDFVAQARAMLASSGSSLDAQAVSVLHRQDAVHAVSPTGPAPVSRLRWPASAQAVGRAAAAATRLRRRDTPLTSVYVAPNTTTELQIAAVWEDVLGVRPIGVHDDLFSLGGDSMTAALLCSQLHRHGLYLTVDDLLRGPTIYSAARRIKPKHSTPDTGTDAPGTRAASFGQQRVWAADMLEGGAGQIIPLAYHIRGPLDANRLRSACTAVVARHPALRTGLSVTDGVLYQHVWPADGFRLPVIDLIEKAAQHEVDRHAHEFWVARFDLARGPMMRAALISRGDEDHLLLLALHHSAADGWSADLVQRDLGVAYADSGALTSSPPTPTFLHYASAVEERWQRGEFAEAAAEVLSVLGHGGTPLGGIRCRERADPRYLRFPLGVDLLQRVRAAAQRHTTTPATIYFAAHQLLVGLQSGAEVVTGYPVANRSDPAFADTVGYFANIVPVVSRTDWSRTLGGHVDATAAATTQALRHAEVPYGLLAKGQGALFDTMFTLQPPAAYPLRLTGCAVSPAEPVWWPLPCPLMLDVHEDADGGNALLRFDVGLRSTAEATWLAEAYPLVLAALWARPGLPLRHLRALLRPAEAAVHELVHRRLRLLRGDGGQP